MLVCIIFIIIILKTPMIARRQGNLPVNGDILLGLTQT